MAAKFTFRDRNETTAHVQRLWHCRVYLRGSEWLKNKTTCEAIGHRERKGVLGRASMRAEHHILSAGVHKGITAQKEFDSRVWELNAQKSPVRNQMRRHGAACCKDEDQEGNTATKVSDGNVRATGRMYQDAIIQKPRLCIHRISTLLLQATHNLQQPAAFGGNFCSLTCPHSGSKRNLGSLT
jgi:hypothetical protein